MSWAHDRQAVLDRMRYWHRPLLVQPPSSQYLAFDIDCGGFNNIRMGFEFAVLIAFVTHRTLVLPPSSPWYLIDWGPMKRMKRDTDARTTTSLDEYFNMSSLRAAVPVISSARFIREEASRLQIPLSGLKFTKRGRVGKLRGGSGGDSGGGVLHLIAAHNVTWRSAKLLCKARQRRLCSYTEICPPAAAGTQGSASRGGQSMRDREPWLWSKDGRLTGDHWAPFVTKPHPLVHDWVEVGDSAGRQCLRHATMGLPPVWEESSVALKGHVFCCDGTLHTVGAQALASARRKTGLKLGRQGQASRLSSRGTARRPLFGEDVGAGSSRAAGVADGDAMPSEDALDAALAGHEGGKWWKLTKAALGENLPWSSLVTYVGWPSVAAVEADDESQQTVDAVAHRRGVEYSGSLRPHPLLNLPSCRTNEAKWRYLGQVANAVVAPAGDADGIERSVRQVLRDGVRYVDVVWEVAARVVAQLGAFRYSSLHIRRNELQYKTSWVDASVTLSNIEALLEPGEPLYLATDETSPGFFDTIRAKHPQLYQWRDLFTAKAGNVLSGIEIPRKLVGCIEQAICAMGRRFIGTEYSTFTGYINRLRGYVNAPDKLIYVHNVRWSADEASNRRRQKRPSGDRYLADSPLMWETTQGVREAAT